VRVLFYIFLLLLFYQIIAAKEKHQTNKEQIIIFAGKDIGSASVDSLSRKSV